jgi:ubiquinone biosynthesis accessory factor UbiJ
MLNSLFGDLVNTFTGLQPPAWMVDEVQHRLVLLLNHVLMQEPEATARLTRLKSSIVCVHWRDMTLALAVTPAGLVERVNANLPADLKLLIAEDSPTALLQNVLTGSKPTIKIEGDVMLAAELNWLADHVRWDVEEDLSRVLGDAPAHALVSMVKQSVVGLKLFLVDKVADNVATNTAAKAAK